MNNINQYLTSVNREVGKVSIMAFAKMYFPGYLKQDPCSFHRELCKFLETISKERSGRVAVAAPRGHAKSTFASDIYVLWCICYSLESYIVLLSDTGDQAETMLSHVKEELENNELLQRDFPDVCWAEAEKKLVWKKSEIITKNRVKITALGAGQKIRGRRNKQFRPTLIILDDIENDENTRNVETRDKLYEWFTKAVLKAGTTDTNVVVVGTIQHNDCLLAQLTKEKSTGWLRRTYQAVVHFADRDDLWAQWTLIHNGTETYKEETGPKAGKAFYKDHEAEMVKGVEVLWWQKENYYELMVMKEDEGEISFNSEKQNSPYNAKDAIFNPEKFQYWDDTYKTEEDLISACGDKLEFYAACDPSLGKRQGDYSAIIVIAKHIETNKRYVLVADIAKRNQTSLIEAVLRIGTDYQHCLKKFCIESNQFQEVLVNLIQEKANEQGLDLRIECVNNRDEKLGRIQSLEPLVSNGKLQFAHPQRMLLDQLKYFPKDRHDDGPDALAMAVKEAIGSNKVVFRSLTGNEPLPEHLRQMGGNYISPSGWTENTRDYGSGYKVSDGEDD